MNSDNKFYLTLAVISIFGLITIIWLKSKEQSSGNQLSLKGDLSGLENDYTKKYDLKTLIQKNEINKKIPLDIAALEGTDYI